MCGTAIIFVVLLSRSMNRSFNHDEHQFVTPAVLLCREGLLPYRDYPYFHMPNQVYLYAALTWWTPYKLLVARIIQVSCGTAIAVLLCWTGWRLLDRMEPVARGLTAVALTLLLLSSRFFAHANGLAWNHDTSTLCALGALFLHLAGLRRRNALYLIWSGLLLGGAIGIRLTFALAMLPFFLSFWPNRWPRRQRLHDLLSWCLGLAISGLPVIVSLATVPAQFIFGNLGYPRLHAQQVPMTLTAKIGYFVSRFSDEPADAALSIVFLYCTTIVAWRARAWNGPHRNALRLTLGVLLALVPGVLAATPPQRQYAYPLLPFMVLTVIYVLGSMPTRPQQWRVRLMAAALIAIAGAGLPPKYSWQDIVALLTPARWTPIRQHEVGEWIKSATFPGALVLTTTPVPPVEAGLKVYPEFATGMFAWQHAALLLPEDRQRYHMVSAAELDAMLARRPPDAVFFSHPVDVVQPFIDYAEAHGYQRLADPTNQTHALWVRRPADRVRLPASPSASGQASR
jgi:hypothetical protein